MTERAVRVVLKYTILTYGMPVCSAVRFSMTVDVEN